MSCSPRHRWMNLTDHWTLVGMIPPGSVVFPCRRYGQRRFRWLPQRVGRYHTRCAACHNPHPRCRAWAARDNPPRPTAPDSRQRRSGAPRQGHAKQPVLTTPESCATSAQPFGLPAPPDCIITVFSARRDGPPCRQPRFPSPTWVSHLHIPPGSGLEKGWAPDAKVCALWARSLPHVTHQRGGSRRNGS